MGGLVAFNMIASQIVSPVIRLSQLWQDFQQIQVSVARLSDIFNAVPETQNEWTLPGRAIKGAIALQDIQFRYGPQGPMVLRGISLKIPAGEVVGIVGPSGSGKSTLAKLLQRLYPLDSGRILVDGVDIARMPLAWLRRQMGVVMQDSVLFNRTVRENIALSVPSAEAEHVEKVAQLQEPRNSLSGFPAAMTPKWWSAEPICLEASDSA